MAYKTLLVHAADDPEAESRVDFALSVGRLFGATVYGLAVEACCPFAAVPEYSYVPSEALKGLEREVLQRLEAAQSRFAARAQAAGVDAIWALETDFPRDALVRRARSADLVVASRPADPYIEARAVRPADLLMGAGLPVLVKADARSEIFADQVVVGWKNSREARRAVTEAMPFLERAGGVTLVQAARDGDVDRADLEAAAGRLARHGVKVAVEAVAECRNVCEALEAVAARRGADLIVVGGYGHSRWRETVFGGVTQGFLERGVLHVLLSH